VKLNDREKMQTREVVMKKYLVVLAAMMIVIAMVSGAYAIGTTAVAPNVTVIAGVKEICVVGSSGTLDFGTIDPSTSIDVYATGEDTNVKCSNQTVYTVAVASGSHTGSGGVFSGVLAGTGTPASTVTIPYTLNYTPSFTGAGFGTAAPQLIVSGMGSASAGAKITAANANAAQVGNYSDTVLITITY
jgi:spore coat protein U-like protein